MNTLPYIRGKMNERGKKTPRRETFFLSFIFISLFYACPVQSVNISVEIYGDKPVKAAIFAPFTGRYIVQADGKTIDTCAKGSVFEIGMMHDSVVLKAPGSMIGIFSEVHFRGCGDRNQFNIKPLAATATRLYDDALTATVNGTSLKLVNIVQAEHYIAGVIECEAGRRRPPEYFKVQAIICRTYALSNLAKHIADGFELCDGVHCQVYRGAATTSAVINAVSETKGMVLVDQNSQLIVAAFHSNCGGYTLNSEDVWSAPLPYLKAIRDTFCLNMPDARWEKTFPAEEWNSYLKKKEKNLKPDSLRREAYWDSIPECSRIFLYDRGYTIPLKEIRADLNLNSTYFSIAKDGNEVTLHGRGFGHRIGLCQEGAMHMAQLGYNFRQILNFYYTGVQLIDYNILPSSGFN